jgi:hypothetical protein
VGTVGVGVAGVVVVAVVMVVVIELPSDALILPCAVSLAHSRHCPGHYVKI